jgi:hypothetical protein
MWAITYRQRPTFYLHPDIHGITGAVHAAEIGADILGLKGTGRELFVIAIKVDIDG